MRWTEDVEPQWHAETAAVRSGRKDWRAQQPTATVAQIEAAVDERLSGLRARMRARLALASAATAGRDQPMRARPVCAPCGTRLEPRGDHARAVVTQGNHPVHREREDAPGPTCGVGLVPPR